MRKLLSALILALLVLSCAAAKKKEIPGDSIAGIRTSAQRILISPLAFDSALVVVEGVAQGVKVASSGKKGIVFALADGRGNFIYVSAPDAWDVSEGDTLIVGGVYRKSENTIEALRMEKIIPPAK
ncbi:MAG: hypothetical protein ACT4NX_03015 [Deltaproteobacteria bacterium]